MQKGLLRIATRKSPLALWQAKYVRDLLLLYHPNLQIELLPLLTRGDTEINMSLAKMGDGKGLFTKELELALLENHADIAVHSMKDVTISLPERLVICALCERENPYDAFISSQYTNLKSVPLGKVIGTSSLRRQCQILKLRPDLYIKNLRGNIDIRLAKLDQGEFDAIILSVAGLKRLGLKDRIKQILNATDVLPAAGQGTIGIECLVDNIYIKNLIAPLHHQKTAICVTAERALNFHLQGGCQLPIGSYAIINDNDEIWLRGLVGLQDGTVIIRSEGCAPLVQAEKLGLCLAKDLLNQGAQNILNTSYYDYHK